MKRKIRQILLLSVMITASAGNCETLLLYTFDKYNQKDATHDSFPDLSGNGHDAVTNEPLDRPRGHFDLVEDNPFIIEGVKVNNNKSVRSLAQWRKYSPENIQTIYDGKTNQWTVEAWIKSASSNAPTNYFCIFGFGAKSGKSKHTQSIKLGFIANKTKNRTTPALEFNNGIKTHVIFNHDVFFWAEQWVHVAAMYDGKTVKLYVNGKKIGTAASGEKMLPLTHTTLHADDKSQFKGNIDDLRFSDKALDSAELGYYGPLSPKTQTSTVNLNAATKTWIDKAKTDGVRFIWTNTYPYGDTKWNGNKVKKLELHMGRVKKHGINIIGVGYELFRDIRFDSTKDKECCVFDEQRVAHLRRVIRAAKKENLPIMIILQTYKEPYIEIIKTINYRKVMDIHGKIGSELSCPADWSFFRRVELPRMELVARLLLEENAVGGILYETEAYCAKTFYPGYGSQKTHFCYCDTCFKKFMNLIGSKDALPIAGKRYEWLCRRGIDGTYQEYMVNVFAETYKKLFGEVRKINPETLAGLYQLGIDPNSDGFAKGVATNDSPAMLFSSAEYFYGYDRPEILGFANYARSSDFQAHLAGLKLNTWFLGGLITGPYWPKQYAAELNLLLRRTDGYWMYDGSIFLKPAKSVVTKDPKSRNQYRLRDTPAHFWTEIAKINKTKPQRTKETSMPSKLLPLNTNFKLVNPQKHTSHQPVKTLWKCMGVDLNSLNGIYRFPADGIVLGKRTSSIEAMFENTLEIGVTYGLCVKVSNTDIKHSRWINLGYSRKPPYPIFYDTNILVPPSTNKEYKYVFHTTKKWGTNYWVRVGVRNGKAPLSVEPISVEKLYEVEFTSDEFTLPQGKKVCLTMPTKDGNIFKFRYDLISTEDGKDLMTTCNETTDVSGLNYLDITKAKVRVRLFTAVPGVFEKCPKLRWSVWENK